MSFSPPAAAGALARERLGPARLAGLVSVGLALLHLAVAGASGLSVDEAHYALYGRFLDWSYFDHPPLVGWLQAAVLSLSSAEWALRLWPVLLSLVAAWLVFRLTRALFPEEGPWSGAVAVLLLQSMLVFQVLSVGLVPELPLVVAALAAALALYRAVERGTLGAWVATGLLFGLAGLAKYTAVTLVVSALLFLAWQGRWERLRQSGPWLAVLLAVAVIAPVIYWNAVSDWASFRYQLGHGAPARDWSLGRFATAQAGQLLGYGPLVYLGGLAVLAGLRHELAHPGVRFSLALAVPVLLLFGWTGGFEETLPHWTLWGWVGLLPLLARGLCRGWERKGVRRLVVVGGIYSGALTLLIHSLLFAPWVPAPDYRHPLADLHGWEEAARRAAARLEGTGGAAIYVTNWTQASRVAWYARPLPVQVLDSREDQFDRWFGNPRPGDAGILLQRSRGEGGPPKAAARFARCERLEAWTHRLGGRPVHRFSLWHCKGFGR